MPAFALVCTAAAAALLAPRPTVVHWTRVSRGRLHLVHLLAEPPDSFFADEGNAMGSEASLPEGAMLMPDDDNGRGTRRRQKGSSNRKRNPQRSRSGSRRSPAATPAGPPLDVDEKLAAARAAFQNVCDSYEDPPLEFIGAVLQRVPKGPHGGSFKCWIDSECGIDAALLGEASQQLRDALWEALPNRPGISVLTPGRTRPLFHAADFERFRGQRAQVTLRKPTDDGRKKLVGELLGVLGPEDEPARYVVVRDESAGMPVHAPFDSVAVGEKTSLLPLHAASGPLAQAKPKRGGKLPGEEEAEAFVVGELARAPIVVFLKSYCPYCRRALKVLREDGGLEPGDPRLHIVKLEDRADMIAVQQHLKVRTGESTVPRTFFFGASREGVQVALGAEELEALVDAGPGRVMARLMEAESAFEQYALRQRKVDAASRGGAA